MSDRPPRVSIGLPVYNGQEYLAAQLDSLLGQTFGDFELVLSDNASTDATEEIGRDYAARDRRIRYCREETNRGAAWNFNRAFELARGDYFKWAAHDDLHAPTYLARVVELLDQRPEAVWCHCRSSHVDAAGGLLDGLCEQDVSYADDDGGQRPCRTSPQPHRRFRAVLLDRSCIDVFGLVRRAVMARTRRHLPIYGADKVFVAELSLRGRYVEVPETLFFVRVHGHASGAVATAAEQQQFIDPAGASSFTRMRLLRAFAGAVSRAELGAAERARCYGALLAYVCQVKKWRRIIRGALAGRGVGGSYLSALEAEKVAARREPPVPSGP